MIDAMMAVPTYSVPIQNTLVDRLPDGRNKELMT